MKRVAPAAFVALAAFALLLQSAGCDDKGKSTKAPAAAPETSGPAFHVDVAPPAAGCPRDTSCAVELQLSALGAYHVNREFPFKFVPAPAPGLFHEGTGTFAIHDAKSATMTIRFRAEHPGTAHVTGTFKLSVCSDDACAIEQVPVAVDVPIT